MTGGAKNKEVLLFMDTMDSMFIEENNNYLDTPEKPEGVKGVY